MMRRIEALAAARRTDEAIRLWHAAVDAAPARWQAWFDLAQMGLRLRQPRAIECLRIAARNSDRAAPSVLLARHLLLSGDKIGALRAARAGLALRPADGVSLSHLATVLAHCDAGDEALPLFIKSAALAPANPSILFNLATAQRASGRFAEAEATIEAVLRQRPGDADAHHLRSGLRRQTDAANHVGAMRAALSGAPRGNDPALAPLHFALGKELDDLGRHTEAFAHFVQGNHLRRLVFRYDVADDVVTIDALAARHGAAGLGELPPAVAGPEGPIFIVGLPRSGTTLLERMIATHPDVTAGGELDAFPRAAVASVGAGGLTKQAFVTRALAVPPDVLGRTYLAEVGERRGDTPRFTDKLPINGLYVGLIARALPGATILLMQREPMANGFAMYSTLFGDAFPFSYALDELGGYMRAWNRLMDHWRAVLGARLLTVRYEDLVIRPEPTLRAVLAHCGLPWDPACLAFHESKGSVSSASAVQVRQPLHRASVDRWRAYEPQLAPLRLALDGGEADPAA